MKVISLVGTCVVDFLRSEWTGRPKRRTRRCKNIAIRGSEMQRNCSKWTKSSSVILYQPKTPLIRGTNDIFTNKCLIFYGQLVGKYYTYDIVQWIRHGKYNPPPQKKRSAEALPANDHISHQMGKSENHRLQN